MVVLVGGAGGAALCKYYLNCHLRATSHVQVLSNRTDEGRGSTGLPRGFTQTVVARGLTFPTDFARLPDGRLLVTEKDGLVRVVEDGRVLARPFLDLRARAATKSFEGIIAIEAAPDFQQSGLVYVLYVERAAEPKGELLPQRNG